MSDNITGIKNIRPTYPVNPPGRPNAEKDDKKHKPTPPQRDKDADTDGDRGNDIDEYV